MSAYYHTQPGTLNRVILGAFALVTIVLAVAWSVQLDRFESIFQGISALICYVAPPITTGPEWCCRTRRTSAAS